MQTTRQLCFRRYRRSCWHFTIRWLTLKLVGYLVCFKFKCAYDHSHLNFSTKHRVGTFTKLYLLLLPSQYYNTKKRNKAQQAGNIFRKILGLIKILSILYSHISTKKVVLSVNQSSLIYKKSYPITNITAQVRKRILHLPPMRRILEMSPRTTDSLVQKSNREYSVRWSSGDRRTGAMSFSHIRRKMDALYFPVSNSTGKH